MSRIVLVWNEHPTEVLAGYHARKAAQLLRKKGHEVIVEKIPVSQTPFGILREIKLGMGSETERLVREAAVKLLNVKSSEEITDELKARRKADFCFNFHTTSTHVSSPVEKISLTEVGRKPEAHPGRSITFYSSKDGRRAEIEMPDYALQLTERQAGDFEKRLKLVRKYLPKSRDSEEVSPIDWMLAYWYHSEASVARVPKAKGPILERLLNDSHVKVYGANDGERRAWLEKLVEKYKHPLITEKIVGFIQAKTLKK